MCRTLIGDDETDYFALNVTAEATGWSDFDTSDPSLIETSTVSVLSSVCVLHWSGRFGGDSLADLASRRSPCHTEPWRTLTWSQRCPRRPSTSR
jgi:hypothetical protein